MDSKLIWALVAAGLAVILIVTIVAVQSGGDGDSSGDENGASDDMTGTIVDGGEAYEPSGPGLGQGGGEDAVGVGGVEVEGDVARPEQDETISVVVTDYPSEILPGGLSAVYHDTVVKRDFYDNETPGRMTLQGPNRLGGELAVYFRKSDETLRLWAYVRKVSKRHIGLPADADIVVGETDLVESYLSFAKEDVALLVNWEGVGFFASADSKLPLFLAAMNVGTLEVADYSKVPFKAVSGQYHIRAIVSKDGHERQVSLGTLEVRPEKLSKYEIDVPYK
jgi:hypothetical protein